MARTSIWRRTFNREADFVILKPFDVDGVAQLPGKPFVKSSVSIRTHRQLYTQRYVGETDSAGKPSGASTPAPVQPPALASGNAPSPSPAEPEPASTGVVIDLPDKPPNKSAVHSRKAKDAAYQIKKDHGTKWAVWKSGKKVSRAMSKVKCQEFVDANTRSAE